MNKRAGFTLIEILIALMIFSILAVMTSTAMYHAFNTRAKINEQADRLSSMQLSLSLLEHDIRQMANRAVRGNQLRLVASFIGQPQYMEFTRDGVANPGSMEKRSTMKRIAILCENGALKRRSWSVLDAPDRSKWDETVLLNNITSCKFTYLNQTLQILNEWREVTPEQGQTGEIFPKAIQLNITLEVWGNANLIFIVPEALYAKVQ